MVPHRSTLAAATSYRGFDDSPGARIAATQVGRRDDLSRRRDYMRAALRRLRRKFVGDIEGNFWRDHYREFRECDAAGDSRLASPVANAPTQE